MCIRDRIFIIQSFSCLLKKETVVWNTDNFNATQIIKVGSTKEYLQKLALEIYSLCLINDFETITQWIPREFNDFADGLSKTKDNDNWSVDDESFLYIESVFGKLTINRFADDLNTKKERFNSKEFCPFTETVNAFSCDWSKDFNWLCPPISQVGKTIRHLRKPVSYTHLTLPTIYSV